ncbi:sperm-associated antigen 16 protein [Leuresthes tenuis]|uniref:sperm-associated antigen 16 protein n=1 Tax=Leuresthes tenuis TaxID=355514 RepID=UPI003B512193
MSARRTETAEERRTEDLSEEERKSAKDEDFEEAMKEAASSTQRKLKPPDQQIILSIPETVDDFLRNFLRRAGLNRTLSCFEAEWYGSTQKLLAETLTMETADTGIFFIPDALTHGQLLQHELDSVHRETDQLRQQVLAAAENLLRMQRERDFHRLQYQRLAEQKNKLVNDFKQLREHLQSYKLVLKQLDVKYQTALRQKRLISLQKDLVQKTTDPGLNQEKAKEKKESIKSHNRAEKSAAKSTNSNSS